MRTGTGEDRQFGYAAKFPRVLRKFAVLAEIIGTVLRNRLHDGTAGVGHAVPVEPG